MRIRTVKPEFWSSEDLAAVSEGAVLLAVGLLSHADDDGLFSANERLIKANLYPLRDPSVNIRRMLDELSRVGYVELGTGADGRRYGRVVNFRKHQKIDRPTKSKIAGVAIEWDPPSPCGYGAAGPRNHGVCGTSLEVADARHDGRGGGGSDENGRFGVDSANHRRGLEEGSLPDLGIREQGKDKESTPPPPPAWRGECERGGTQEAGEAEEEEKSHRKAHGQDARATSEKADAGEEAMRVEVLRRLKGMWPKQVRMDKADGVWARLAPDGAMCGEIEAAARAWCASKGWRREGGRYAPRLWAWLRDEGWRDQVTDEGVELRGPAAGPPSRSATARPASGEMCLECGVAKVKVFNGERRCGACGWREGDASAGEDDENSTADERGCTQMKTGI